MIRLGGWLSHRYLHTDVPAQRTIEVPHSSLKEWHIYSWNYERMGKFGLNPVHYDKTGHCSKGVTRTKFDGGYMWVWNNY